MSESSSSQPDRKAKATPPVQRACDGCRTRKIRCDKLSPCSHCRAASITCRTTLQPTKVSVNRSLVSKQYEAKIERLETHLRSIEDFLRARGSPSIPSNRSPSVSALPGSSLEHGGQSPAPVVPFAGPTAADAHSIVAKDHFEQIFSCNPVAAQDESLRAALTSLQRLVGMMKMGSSTSSHNSGVSDTLTVSDNNYPAWETITSIFERAADGFTGASLAYLPTISLARSHRLAKECYPCTANTHPAQRILVYSGLYIITTACLGAASDPHAADHSMLAPFFQRQVEAAIECLPFMMPATKENIEALYIAASCTIDMCKPSECWALISKAAAMCQTLGYHRIGTMAQDTERERDEKIALFWYVYMTDKTVSLRLGRAATIQDYDISLPVPERSAIFPEPYIPFLRYWIEVARIQGQVAEQLYSPAAALLRQQERWRRADGLSSALEHAFEGRLQLGDSLEIETSSPADRDLYRLVISSSDVIVHYSTLTLIQFSAPPTDTGLSPALAPARSALKAIQQLGEKKELLSEPAWTSYLHWVTLNMPFTPFTVVFGHIIARYRESGQDLQLLRGFVSSLEHVAPLSEGVSRFHQLCSTFYQVAEAYVSAKNRENNMLETNELPFSQQQGALVPTLEEIDECLAILDYGQPPLLEADYSNTSTTDVEGEEQLSSYLYNWYSGNASLVGLMEFGFD